ncbi:MAG: hypothetical protein ACREFJ_16445 [Acetobacteraceae bacterium]
MISASERGRLQAMLALAEAEQNPADGERLAAIIAVERLLGRHGLRLRDLATPAPEKQLPLLGTWRQTCRECLESGAPIRPWERKFLSELPEFPRLSVKQRYVLYEIADRIGVARGRAA